MFTSLQTRLKKASRWLPVALLPFAAHAQFNYPVNFAVNTTGTYTDLGTAGTAIATANTDDDNSAAQPIGFTFNYNGAAFTQFVLNTNGLIRLGSAAPSSAAAFPAYAQAPETAPISTSNAADVNLISPFNLDLGPGSAGGTEYRVSTTGTAPNRVCTIQWKNVADKPQAAAAGITTVITTQLANFSFQVKLYESSNVIEFVYGSAIAGTGTANAKYAAVGIKGSAPTASVIATKSSSTTWSTTTFLAGPYLDPTQANAHNVRQTFLPDAGRTYRFSPTVAIDASVAAVYTLTKLPIPQGAPHVVRATVTNTGTNAQSNLNVTLSVTGANTFSNTQVVPSLAAGASATVTFAAYTPTATGTNTVTVALPNDGNNSNNTMSVSQSVNATDYSYSDASAPNSARGFNPNTANPAAVNAFLSRFTASTATTVTQVRAMLVNFVTTPTATQDVTIGKTVYGVVVNATTGAVLGRSPDLVVTAANVAGTYTTFTLTTPVAVPAGDFLVGLAQTYQSGQTVIYFPLGTQPEIPTRTGTYYTSSITTPAAPIDVTSGTTPFDSRPMLEAVTTATGPATCLPATALTVGSITQSGASISFTAPASTSGYVVTYGPAGGTATTLTPAPTTSPFTLTGLAPSTTYNVLITSNCSTSSTGGTAGTTFTTLAPPVSYASLPYTQDFEGPWVNGLSTRDIPDTYWRNSPATGDNSWRREDDGFASASWQYLSYETPTSTNPTPPYVTRFSTGAHSARFHTFGSSIGLQGNFDLYVNLSGTGTKTLTFDYINPTGTDKLEVLVSTDGGATFGAPVLTATTNTAFTGKTVVIPSTSATTVIRFRATSDFGNDDLGIDNLRLSILSATRNETLAATVGLYPNPAHQRFTLAVPAGRLNMATATLINALGQAVQTKQLNLPAAGGSTEFDVSRLAAGVYSLQLKSGNDLVVKRVVVE